MFHAKSLNDDSFKNHADRVWRIVKYEAYLNKKSNTFKVVEGDTIKFGRVRFKIRKLVIDKNDIESMNADDLNDMTSLPSRPGGGNNNDSITQNQLRQLTTLENDNISALHGNDRVQTDPETRMTMNFNRETLGFDNKPFEFDENLMK